MKKVYIMIKKMFSYPVELKRYYLSHVKIAIVINNNVWMDLSHQVNTIATINTFCMSNITCINFDIA